MELIKGLVQVRDALSLAAFLALVLLLAFRTTKVPELFFGLLRDKLTRQQFVGLLHRFMTLAFVAFLALLALAVTSQILSRWTRPSALTVDDLRGELAKASQSFDEKLHAESQYTLAMERLGERDFDGAIASLKDSIQAVPSLTAREMLIYLYRQKGDFADASKAWEEAVKTAREHGDSLALVRLNSAVVPAAIPDAEGEHDLIGASAPLAKGGDKYETALAIGPGLYMCGDPGTWWFSVRLQSGQTLQIKFRSPASGGVAGIRIYGTNGQVLKQAGDEIGPFRSTAGGASTLYQANWTAIENGSYFIRSYADPGTVFRIYIR